MKDTDITSSSNTDAFRAMLDASGSRAGLELLSKIESREAIIGVVGLGYVGLPLVEAVHDAGYSVIGFDVDQTKIEKLNRGESYLKHLGDELTHTLAESERFKASSEESVLADADIVILCVPTPLGEYREPDLSYVIRSAEVVGRSLRSGQLVLLESTTYPGTTREELAPILVSAAASRGLDLQLGKDYFVAYSPEREDPGRAGVATSDIPKLVGGIDDASSGLAIAFYESCIERVYPVRTAEIAEAAKLLENVYRAVNIALVNELKVVFDRLDIDIWEVIEAAKTKPFGFQAFYPGPGLGGHCIPIDPFYLTWKAKATGLETKFIELAGEINKHMPEYVVQRVMEALNDDRKAMHGAKILILGLAYKPNVDDIRESPAAEIIKLCNERGAEVQYHDTLIPVFPRMRRYWFDMQSIELDESVLRDTDCVIIVTDHDITDWDLIGKHASLIVDTRNAMDIASKQNSCSARIVKA